MGRGLLKTRGVPNFCWAEAVTVAVYILNMSPTKAMPEKTPFEVWYGYPPSTSHIRVFGCVAYALKSQQDKKKFDDKSEKCVFIGYSVESKAYRLLNPTTGKVFVCRNVKFNEEEWWNWKGKEKKLIF